MGAWICGLRYGVAQGGVAVRASLFSVLTLIGTALASLSC